MIDDVLLVISVERRGASHHVHLMKPLTNPTAKAPEGTTMIGYSNGRTPNYNDRSPSSQQSRGRQQGYHDQSNQSHAGTQRSYGFRQEASVNIRDITSHQPGYAQQRKHRNAQSERLSARPKARLREENHQHGNIPVDSVSSIRYQCNSSKATQSE